jgi:rsbT antagonist protein RsbS
MSVSILGQGPILIASLQGDLTDSQWSELCSSLLQRVGQRRSKGVVLDVSAMEIMDSFATRTLRALAQMLRLRGAETVVVGIQPDVAYAMARLGLRMTGAKTAIDLDEGLEALRTIAGKSA